MIEKFKLLTLWCKIKASFLSLFVYWLAKLKHNRALKFSFCKIQYCITATFFKHEKPTYKLVGRLTNPLQMMIVQKSCRFYIITLLLYWLQVSKLQTSMLPKHLRQSWESIITIHSRRVLQGKKVEKYCWVWQHKINKNMDYVWKKATNELIRY